jgi:cyclic pyranopterin phosphate synthase
MRLPIVEHVSARAAGAPAGFEAGPRSIGAVRVLRISITDRCNFRCVYCMPEEGVRWLPREDILGFEEICEIVRAAIEVHGIRRFKLTGGEPTVRHGLVDLVAMLRRISGIEDFSLTTNGQRMTELAGPLREAGLDRVTISLDSLRPDRFRRITRTGDLSTVLKGLDRCAEVGFASLKVNCVTMRGTNDDELVDFARLSLDRPLTVRFIEYMPLGDAALMNANSLGTCGVSEKDHHGRGAHATEGISQTSTPSPGMPGEGWGEGIPRVPGVPARVAEEELGPAGGCGAQDRGRDSLIPEPQVRDAIEAELGPLVAVERDSEVGVGPAKVYRLGRGNPLGRIGFISAMSAPFCSTCNRLRLTANGVLRSCLFEGGEVDVRHVLRAERDPVVRCQAIAQAMTDCVRLKPEVHSHRGNEQMSRIGG